MRGVVVLGMHRSGTSAATRALNLLGLHTCADEDLLGAGPSNPRGHWESTTVVACNEVLLTLGDGGWSCPPRRMAWAKQLHSLRDAGTDAFRAVHSAEPFVVKDPRMCLTFPFWRDALEPTAVVVVLRDPSAIARSHQRRDRMDPTYAVALWERHLRSALEAAAGLPACVVRYDDLIDSPKRWCEEVRELLESAGIPLGRPPMTEIRRFVASDLRHFAADEALVLSEQQRDLWELCSSLVGGHAPLSRLGLPRETPSTARRFGARRRRVDNSWVLNLRPGRLPAFDTFLVAARHADARFAEQMQPADRPA